jgi:hypothetical protein
LSVAHKFADGHAPHHEHPVLGLTTEMCEPEEIEGFRFPFATFLAVFDREPAKPQQACFLWVESQVELGESGFQSMTKTSCIFTLFKPKHAVVCVPQGDHLALCCTPTPLPDPQIHHVVQVDIGQQR